MSLVAAVVGDAAVAGSDDPQPRIHSPQHAGRFLRGAWRTTEQKNSVPLLGGERDTLCQQVVAGDARPDRRSLHPGHPDQRHSIRRDQIGAVDHIGKRRVSSSRAQELEIGRNHVVGGALLDEAVQKTRHLVRARLVDLQIENADPFTRFDCLSNVRSYHFHPPLSFAIVSIECNAEQSCGVTS